MQLITTAAAAVNQTPLSWDNNFNNLVAAVKAAREQGAQLICLPELSITGYGCEDAFHAPDVSVTALQQLKNLLPETSGIVVAVGLPLFLRGAIYNVVALLVDGAIAGFVAKQNLAGDGVHYEPRWFKPWPVGVVDQVEIDGKPIPVGDCLFDVGGVRIGFEICEDAWSANRPGVRLAALGVDVILNPSASHFAFEKYELRKRFVLEGCRAFGSAYIYANLQGNEAGRIIYDGGGLIASEGQLLAEGKRFSFKESEVVTAVIDIDAIRMIRARRASMNAVVGEVPGLVDVPFKWHGPQAKALPPELDDSWAKEEEFCRSVALGLFDYMRKTWSRGYVLSLSGGADSASVAVLLKQMVDFAVADLGEAGLLERLSYMGATDLADLRSKLLTCVYQATRNSSDTTEHAAETLAKAVGSTYYRLDVDPLVQEYTQIVSGALNRKLTWEEDDLALQNIQARTRGPSVWMLANVEGGILVSTSNRSEAAVGYATMDGDTCGGLSPLAGIDKAFLLEWLQWCEKTGPVNSEPMPVLSLINEQQPTAELRPSEAGQTDEADLMPYKVLDIIERLSIRDKKMPVDIYRTLRLKFPNVEIAQLVIWIERFYTLWCRNQWKRERYAPSFHLDDANLDPKTWCRFPILSGGYRMELEVMRQAANEEIFS